MFKLLKPIKVSKLLEHFPLSYSGNDIEILYVSSLDKLTSSQTFSFSKKGIPENLSGQIIVSTEVGSNENTIILSKNPRLDFAKILNWLTDNVGFELRNKETNIHPSVKIGSNSFIGLGVTIGEGTIIGHNVVICNDVQIGKNCFIKSNTVIGEDGFGYERDYDGFPVKFPHLGSVILEDNVDIGSLVTLVRGALGDTLIKKGAKIDDHVHVAHNCIISENALVTACAELSGGVVLEKNTWIGPNSSILQKVRIGENSLVGLGTVVLKNVDPNLVVVGVPAKPLSKKS